MTDLIPAAPGWYLHSRAVGATDPVIAWMPATEADGSPTLLPFVPNGRGYPPTLVTAKVMEDCEWEIVYRPNPATED